LQVYSQPADAKRPAKTISRTTMAIYTTFFLCEPHELYPAFPGWKLSLPEPVSRTRTNPFTGEETTVKTREPEWIDVDPNDMQMPEIGVVAIEGDYETYSQNRIPSFVQSKPHWCAKNLTSIELEPLIAAATGIEEQELETALYAHPSLSAGIEHIPSDFVDRLKSSNESVLNSIAKKWAAIMSTPDFTHSVDGERIEDDMGVVRQITDLAKKQENDQSMYLLTEA